MTVLDLLGEDGVCEKPHLRAELGGYELEVSVEPLLWSTSLSRATTSLSTACRAALAVASTVRPDPGLPGGVVIHARASRTLEELEGCTWEGAFEPDTMALFHNAVGSQPLPYDTFDAQTWRFGREPLEEVALALATNQRRGFCPPPLTR